MRDVTPISGGEIGAEGAPRFRRCAHCGGAEILPAIDLANRLALRPTEAARVLGVSDRKLREMLPRLPHFRDGGTVLISADGLRRYVAERASRPDAATSMPLRASDQGQLDGRSVADEILRRLKGT